MNRKRENSRPDGQGMISAAELACFAYCPEQWRLQHGLGLDPENRASLAAGNRHHAKKALAERIAGISIELGWLLATLAAVGLFLLIWWWA